MDQMKQYNVLANEELYNFYHEYYLPHIKS